jgi:hypothetical protein
MPKIDIIPGPFILAALCACSNGGVPVSNEGTKDAPVQLSAGEAHNGTVERAGTSYYRLVAPLTGEYAVAFRVTGSDHPESYPIDLSWKLGQDTDYSVPHHSYNSVGGNLLWPDTSHLLFYLYEGRDNITQGDVIELLVQNFGGGTTTGEPLTPKDAHFELTVSYDPRSEGSARDPVVLSIGTPRPCTVLYASRYTFQTTNAIHQITLSNLGTDSLGCYAQPEGIPNVQESITPLQPESISSVAADPIGEWFAIWCGAFGYISPEHQTLFKLTVL